MNLLWSKDILDWNFQSIEIAEEWSLSNDQSIQSFDFSMNPLNISPRRNRFLSNQWRTCLENGNDYLKYSLTSIWFHSFVHWLISTKKSFFLWILFFHLTISLSIISFGSLLEKRNLCWIIPLIPLKNNHWSTNEFHWQLTVKTLFMHRMRFFIRSTISSNDNLELIDWKSIRNWSHRLDTSIYQILFLLENIWRRNNYNCWHLHFICWFGQLKKNWWLKLHVFVSMDGKSSQISQQILSMICTSLHSPLKMIKDTFIDWERGLNEHFFIDWTRNRSKLPQKFSEHRKRRSKHFPEENHLKGMKDLSNDRFQWNKLWWISMKSSSFNWFTCFNKETLLWVISLVFRWRNRSHSFIEFQWERTTIDFRSNCVSQW